MLMEGFTGSFRTSDQLRVLRVLLKPSHLIRNTTTWPPFGLSLQDSLLSVWNSVMALCLMMTAQVCVM